MVADDGKEPCKLGKLSQGYLNRFREANLFADVGMPYDGNHATVSSWREAVSACQHIDNKNNWLEAQNHISVQLPDRIRNTWNRIGAAVDIVIPVISARLSDAVGKNNLPADAVDKIKPSVTWNVGHCMFECEFSEFLTTRFFRDTMEIFLAGHFPCGYEEEYPNGRMIIY